MGAELLELDHHFSKQVSRERFVSGSTPQSLLTSLGHYSSDETLRRWRIPCVLPAAGTHCQYCYYSYLHRQKGFFLCAVSNLHIKTCSEQKWELMSCLLCAILSEINRYGCMKGPCVTKGSNGKFLITWNIRKGDVFFFFFFKQRFSCGGLFLPAVSGFWGKTSCCLANVKALFLSQFLCFFP